MYSGIKETGIGRGNSSTEWPITKETIPLGYKGGCLERMKKKKKKPKKGCRLIRDVRASVMRGGNNMD